MLSSPPPSRGSALSEAIVAELRQLIYTGEFKPGERLNEAALALRMGTSRGPIREAIKVLAGQGIVHAVTNRGVFVRQLSLRDMVEAYELQAVVFGYAADRACGHLTEGQKAQLGALLAAMDAACEAEDGTLFYELNLQFHALVLVISNNRRAHQAYDDYVKELHQMQRKYFNVPGNMRRANVEHREIYEAIVAANRKRARAAAEHHMASGRARLLANFEEPLAGG